MYKNFTDIYTNDKNTIHTKNWTWLKRKVKYKNKTCKKL